MNDQFGFMGIIGMKQTLKEIATISAGQGAPQGDENYCDNGTPFVKAGNLSELLAGKPIQDIQQVSEEVAKKHRLKLYRKGTVLFAKSGMSCLKGYTYVLPIDAYVVSHLACVTPNEDTSTYLKYYFTYHRPNQLIKDEAYPSISLEDIGNLQIDMKTQSERERITCFLEQTKSIISLRQHQLQSLDTLTKARFIEMFGDPVIRLDLNETKPLESIATKITVGYVGEASKNYAEIGVPYLRTQNVRINQIDLDGLIYVNESFHYKNQKSIVHPGDVVVSRVGVNRGMAAVIPDILPEANIANCLIVGQTDNINPYYLAFYMNMSFGKRPQFGASVGSAQGVINTAILKKWEIYLPPKQKQIVFHNFIAKVDKSKSIIQQALAKDQLLFDSLMQKYFG